MSTKLINTTTGCEVIAAHNLHKLAGCELRIAGETFRVAGDPKLKLPDPPAEIPLDGTPMPKEASNEEAR